MPQLRKKDYYLLDEGLMNLHRLCSSDTNRKIYTGALNQTLLLSFFAWPIIRVCQKNLFGPNNNQIITWSYMKHILHHYDTVLANQRAFLRSNQDWYFAWPANRL